MNLTMSFEGGDRGGYPGGWVRWSAHHLASCPRQELRNRVELQRSRVALRTGCFSVEWIEKGSRQFLSSIFVGSSLSFKKHPGSYSGTECSVFPKSTDQASSSWEVPRK